MPDGAGVLVQTTVQFPVWMDPVANGGTPMTRALGYADDLVARWVDEHPGGFPPIVLNLTDGESTDGESTDGDPTSVAIGLAPPTATPAPALSSPVTRQAFPSTGTGPRTPRR